MGHLIPAGTGFPTYRSIKLRPLVKPVEEPAPEKEVEDDSNPDKVSELKASLGMDEVYEEETPIDENDLGDEDFDS